MSTQLRDTCGLMVTHPSAASMVYTLFDEGNKHRQQCLILPNLRNPWIALPSVQSTQLTRHCFMNHIAEITYVYRRWSSSCNSRRGRWPWRRSVLFVWSPKSHRPEAPPGGEWDRGLIGLYQKTTFYRRKKLVINVRFWCILAYIISE